jgi:NhaP-type Na+/H+ or K+/H+ antiporter
MILHIHIFFYVYCCDGGARAVLFHTFSDFLGQPLTVKSLFKAIGTFLGVSIGSTVIGFASGLLLSFITKRIPLENGTTHYHLSLILLTGFMSYNLADAVQMSGIMSLFFCAVCLAHYNLYNLPPDAAHASHSMVKSLAHLVQVFHLLTLTRFLSFSLSY